MTIFAFFPHNKTSLSKIDVIFYYQSRFKPFYISTYIINDNLHKNGCIDFLDVFNHILITYRTAILSRIFPLPHKSLIKMF